MCSVLVVCLMTTMEKSEYDVRNVSDRCTHCVLVWRKSSFVSLSGVKTVLLLVCVLCICIFVCVLYLFFVLSL